MEYCLQQGLKNGIKAVLARITEGNDISIKLHEHFGFFMVGVLKQVGVKFNKVLDVNLMQLLVEEVENKIEKEDNKIEKINFFVIFILFLLFETIIASKFLNKK
jgi:hypothetical protein